MSKEEQAAAMAELKQAAEPRECEGFATSNISNLWQFTHIQLVVLCPIASQADNSCIGQAVEEAKSLGQNFCVKTFQGAGVDGKSLREAAQQGEFDIAVMVLNQPSRSDGDLLTSKLGLCDIELHHTAPQKTTFFVGWLVMYVMFYTVTCQDLDPHDKRSLTCRNAVSFCLGTTELSRLHPR